MKKTTVVLITIALLFILIVATLSIYIVEGLGQVQKQERTALQLLVASPVSLQEIDEISFFAGEEAQYYTIQGKDPQGKEKLVWLNEAETLEYETNRKMQREEAAQAALALIKNGKVLRLTPALLERRPAWEVFLKDTYRRYWYLYFQMEDGRLIRQYQLQ